MADEKPIIDFGTAPRDLQLLIDRLKLADGIIVKISEDALKAGRNLSAIQLPSDLAQFTAENQRLTAQLQAQAQALAQLQSQYATLSQRRQQSSQRTAEETVNQGILNRNALESARINSTLAGAYMRLSAQQSQASRNLQDLIVRGRLATQTQREYDRELRTAQREFNTLNQRITAADRAVGRFNRNVGNYPMQAVRGIKDLLGAFGVVGGLSLVASIAKDIFNTTKELISLNNALKLVTETNEKFAQSQAFLSRISEAYGVEINGLTKQFTQFYVSAKDKISGREIEQIFESITKAGASMGLSTEQQEKAFLALNQMMSKGTIQAEELRGQLGEALPGSLGIMAKAVGVTEAELAKMMKAGELLAADVLPKFAKQLEITYGIDNVNRIDNLASAQNRLSNAWTKFVGGLDEDGNKLSAFFSGALKVITKIVEGTTILLQSEETRRANQLAKFRQDGYNSTLNYYNSLDKLKKEDLENDKAYTEEKIANETKEFNRLKGRNLILKAITPERRFGMSREEQTALVAGEAEIKQNKEKMSALNNLISSRLGNVKAVNELLNAETKSTKFTKNDTKDKAEKTKKARRDDIEGLTSYLNKVDILITEVNSEIDRLKVEKIVANADELPAVTFQLEQLKTLREQLNRMPEVDLKIVNTATESKEAIKQLSEEMKNYLNSFSSEFMSNSGFSETFSLLNDEIDGFGENFAVTFNAIAESAQEVFNFISNASQQNFDAEKERLQSQYDTSLEYAGDNKAAQEKLAEDLEKSKKDIANREARAKQKQAIFNIAIDTAQGIVSALASTPPNVPLSIIIGAIGAAQIAMVASKEIPQYWMGGTHDGGLMMVNDGAGSNYKETIVTPDGKVMKPQGRNVIMNAPIGTDIFTHDQWNEQMNNMLKGNGINWSMPAQQQNGISKNDMKEAMLEAIGEQPQYHTNFNGDGVVSYISKRGNITRINTNRANGRGIKF